MRTGASKQFKKKQLNYPCLSDKDVNKGAFIAAISKFLYVSCQTQAFK
jgi:hypothetical protein